MSEDSVDIQDQVAVEPEITVEALPTPWTTKFATSMRSGILSRLWPIWAISLTFSILAIYIIQNLLPGVNSQFVHVSQVMFWVTAVVSLICMYVDSTLGMGYGTTLTPILLLIGYQPLMVIPAMLVSQWLSGISAGISHQSAGNIDLSANSPHLKVAMVLVGCAIIGTLPAVSIVVSLDQNLLKLIIGAIILIVGIVIFITRGHRYRFSWRKIIVLGLIASFNKGISGGGYGPIVTGGQILSGVGGKQAVGITALSEGLACLVGVMGFLASGEIHDISIAYPLTLGAICSVPLSAYTVRKLAIKKITTLIGILTILLGASTLISAIYVLYNIKNAGA